jgi:hypothetical protein
MRIAFVRGAAIVTVFFLPALHLASAQESLDSWKLTRKLAQGRETAPVSLNLEGRDSQLVYLGSFIVNSQGCNSCHTCPSLRAGKTTTSVNSMNYLAGGVPFVAVKSPNLTPDSAGLPGGESYDQFLDSMKNAQHHQDLRLFLQITPFPNFSSMLEGDFKAVYEYLRALPSAAPGSCSRVGEASN